MNEPSNSQPTVAPPPVPPAMQPQSPGAPAEASRRRARFSGAAARAAEAPPPPGPPPRPALAERTHSRPVQEPGAEALRHRRASARAGAGDGVGAVRPRHPGRAAHRLRQVAHLPGAGAAPRAADHRRLAAHRADDRPGALAAPARRARGAARQHGDRPGAAGGARAHRPWRAAHRAHHARDAGVSEDGGRLRAGEAGDDCRRRGALHLRVGPRLPALVPEAGLRARPAGQPAGSG